MPKNYQKFLREALKKIKPSFAERKKLEGTAKKALDFANAEAKKFQARAILAGSLTRDTWLPGKLEFDVFILFPSDLSVKMLESLGLKIGKDVVKKLKGKYKIEYAQHPYVSATLEDIQIDVVPCFEVKDPSKLKSAVDRTPFHVRYIEKKLPLVLSDDVRLLKQFLTANEIYGADAKTEGFSGYVCELLVINYGRFLDVLKQVANWRPGELIDIEEFYPKEEHSKLRKQFKEQPLILIDPTDKKRNAVAAVSAQNFYKFIKLTKQFLDKPTVALFFKKEFESLTENELIINQMNRRTELILVKFEPPDVVPDILWPQLRRFADRLQSILEETRYEFRVLRKASYTNEKDLAVVLLEMEFSKLPIIQKRIGPKVFDADDSKRFLDKYKKLAINGPFVENAYWVVELRRKFLTARDKLNDTLKEKRKILEAKGIPTYIAAQISKKIEIISDNEKIMQLVKKDKDFGVFLRRYFEKESLI